MQDLTVFIIYHKWANISNNKYLKYFKVNEFSKNNLICNEIIEESKLNIYNPFLQLRGFMETSAYLHIYWNKLYKNKEMIGITQYDYKHNMNYETLDKDTIYCKVFDNRKIYTNGRWDEYMFPEIRNLDFIIENYNSFFGKSYNTKELEGKPLSLWQSNIYPVDTFVKLCKWLEKLSADIFPWVCSYPYEQHWGSIGGYTERAIAIFNTFEIHEGVKHKNFTLEDIPKNFTPFQYNKRHYYNFFDQNIYAKYLKKITGEYDINKSVNFYMFKALFINNNNNRFSAERINVNGKNGIVFAVNNKEYRIEGLDIEAEDPRIFDINDTLYVLFISDSPYENQKKCLAINKFEEFSPTFLRVRNMDVNLIEKNWAPFVKDNELYFVYNYDPLIIIKYDFNEDGWCDIVYRQNDIQLPINTSETFLRGGSNLIHYRDNYYIGGCHSRIFSGMFYHFTHIVILDTQNWKLKYVSRPVMYNYTGDELGKIENILFDKSNNCIQDPISINKIDENKFYLTINVKDSETLLYEITHDIKDDFFEEKSLGEWDSYTKESNFNLINSI